VRRRCGRFGSDTGCDQRLGGQRQMSIHEALLARRDDLVGNHAPLGDIERLSQALSAPLTDPLLRIYRHFPVCGMEVSFESVAGRVSPPGPEFRQVDDDSVREREHGFYWESPTQILEEINHYFSARAALRAGFLPIASCVFGGDTYHIRISEWSGAVPRLYRIYGDGTDPDGPVPVPGDALELVASSLEELIRVAVFERPPA